MRDKKPTAIILARASSGKQVIDGDTLESQIEEAMNLIQNEDWNYFGPPQTIVESATIDEREQFEELVSYCRTNKDKIDYIVFKDISRITRKGSGDYFPIKREMEKLGILS